MILWRRRRSGSLSGQSHSTDDAASLLVFCNVSKGDWRGGVPTSVLAEASLTVKSGEIVAVVGSRFTGRTTLLQVAAGLQAPDQGEVSIAGRNLASLNRRDRERLRGHVVLLASLPDGLEVGRILARHPILVKGWRPREAHRAVTEALDRFDALGCIGRTVEQLTRWEQLRVVLAWAWLVRPRLLLIDDLIDGHGRARTDQAFAFLRDLAESETPCGVLLSASEVDSVAFCDRVLSIHAGRLRIEADRTGIDDGVTDLQAHRRLRGA